MALWILRGAFVVVAGSVGFILAAYFEKEQNAWATWAVFPIVMLVCVAIIVGDVLIRRKRIEVVSSVYIGIVVGIFLTYLVRIILTPIFENNQSIGKEEADLVLLPIGVVICYICISLLIQTKDEFRFIIPYVEFSREVKGLKPYILDTSVIIDGRIADLVETGALDNQLIMPRFVLSELQAVADSSDKLRRSRGRRGLDILNRMRTTKNVDLNIYEREIKDMAGQPVDMKLVLLAKYLEGKVVTGDYNLNKIARLHNVPVINLNDIANALKPVFLPGEQVEVAIVKAGEEQNQGVGYLDDGTMIVVEDGRSHVGSLVLIAVTSVLQTSAGRMIFGKYEKTLGGGKKS